MRYVNESDHITPRFLYIVPFSTNTYSQLVLYREVNGNMQTQYLIDESGHKIAVVLPLEDYEELLEDIHDLAVIAERKDEPTINFEELKKRLKTDGLL